MKSLKESLFDKDLAKKELKFRDVYKLLPGYAGMQVWGMPIGQMFSTTKIEKYRNPYYPDNGSFVNDFLAKFIGIIVNVQVPSKKDFNDSKSKWCSQLKTTLRKYVRNDWKQEFDEKFEVLLKNRVSNNSGLISIELQDGDVGGYIFNFKIESS